MTKSDSNIIKEIRHNLQIGRATLEYGVDINDAVINGIWRYFSDVEIFVPLPVMPLEGKERMALAAIILQDMDETMLKIEKKFEKASSEKELDKISNGPLGERVDSLWKELAGCYAELINQEIPKLPEHVKEAVAESMVEELAARFETSPEDMIQQIRQDSTLRMLFRRTGLNPDEIV